MTLVNTILELTFIDPNTADRVNSSLEGSSKTVKKLDVLVESIRELENELKEAQYDYYRNVAELLLDAKTQMSAFDAYSAIPHVILIRSKLSAIERELQNHIQWSCREIGPLITNDTNDSSDSTSSIDLQSLSQLYLVIDVLGVPFRQDLLERFAQLQLIAYEKSFKFGSTYDGLEHLDRRYSWFKRLLKSAEDRVSSIFPSAWNLSYYLFVEFSRRTSKHIADVLEIAEKDHGGDAKLHVALLMKSLKSILTFEAEMKAAFAMQIRSLESLSTDEESGLSGAFIAPASIADVFDDYLGPYVQLERQTLEEMMAELTREEELSSKTATLANAATGCNPFESSQKMFEFIKGSLKRCTAYSTGNTYLALSKEFRICLQHYAENLKFRCPSPASYHDKKAQYVISPLEDLLMARIAMTGEYCISTVPPLEQLMKKHINPNLRDEIDFSVQIDAFMEMVSHTFGIMTMGASERLKPAMKMLRATDVATVKEIGDDSKYTREIRSVLNETVPRVRKYLSPAYFQGFCMKLVTTVIGTLLDAIWHLKSISKTGGGQLLLDLQGVKTYLLRMPTVGIKEGEEAPVVSKAYMSLVNSQAFTIERVLKLVCTENEMIENTFKLLWPEGQQSDLDAVKAIRGTGNRILDDMGHTIRCAGGIKDNVTTATHTTIKSVTGGIGNLMKDMMFEDHSTHSQGISEDGHASSHGPGHGQSHGSIRAGASSAASKALGDVKNVFGSLNVFGNNAPAPSNQKSNGGGQNGRRS